MHYSAAPLLALNVRFDGEKLSSRNLFLVRDITSPIYFYQTMNIFRTIFGEYDYLKDAVKCVNTVRRKCEYGVLFITNAREIYKSRVEDK